MTEKSREIQLEWIKRIGISRNDISKKLKCSSRSVYNYFNRVKKMDGLTERAMCESINEIIIKNRYEINKNRK